MNILKNSKFQASFVVICILFSFHILASNFNENKYFSLYNDKILEAYGFIQKNIWYIRYKFKDIWDNYINLVHIKEENDKLLQENRLLKMELQKLHELYLENEILKRDLQFAKNLPERFLSASVIGEGVSNNLRTITIDRGTKDGIEIDMVVITPEGVVGRIINLSESFSQVLLITDYNSAVDVIVQRTRARGILKGQYDSCYIDYFNRSEDIETGDKIITSGMDRLFPKGYFIGIVSKVYKLNYGLFQKVEVTPGVDFSKLETVLVILDKLSDKLSN